MICVASITRYNNPLTTIFEASKLELCRVCNYTCHLSRDAFSTHKPMWDKLIFLNRLIQCDYVLWLDADVVVTRPFRVPLHHSTLFSHDFFGINSGVFVIRLDPQNRFMLNESIRRYYNRYKDRSYYEQLAIKAFYREHSFQHVMIAEHMVKYYPGLYLPKRMRKEKKLREFPPLRHAAGCPKTSSRCIKWLVNSKSLSNSTCEDLDEETLFVRKSIKSDFRDRPI